MNKIKKIFYYILFSGFIFFNKINVFSVILYGVQRIEYNKKTLWEKIIWFIISPIWIIISLIIIIIWLKLYFIKKFKWKK